jgi:hypothetical protein
MLVFIIRLIARAIGSLRGLKLKVKRQVKKYRKNWFTELKMLQGWTIN